MACFDGCPPCEECEKLRAEVGRLKGLLGWGKYSDPKRYPHTDDCPCVQCRKPAIAIATASLHPKRAEANDGRQPADVHGKGGNESEGDEV